MPYQIVPGPEAIALSVAEARDRELTAAIEATDSEIAQADHAKSLGRKSSDTDNLETKRSKLTDEQRRVRNQIKFAKPKVAREGEEQLEQCLQKYEAQLQPAYDRIIAAKQRATAHDKKGEEIVAEWRAAESGYDFLNQQISTITTQLTRYRIAHGAELAAAEVVAPGA